MKVTDDDTSAVIICQHEKLQLQAHIRVTLPGPRNIDPGGG